MTNQDAMLKSKHAEDKLPIHKIQNNNETAMVHNITVVPAAEANELATEAAIVPATEPTNEPAIDPAIGPIAGATISKRLIIKCNQSLYNDFIKCQNQQKIFTYCNQDFAYCCSEIKIVLKDEVLGKQSKTQGTYKIENDLVNGKKHWTSLDGNQAIWYDTKHYCWSMGSSSDRGSSKSGIYSAFDGCCPTYLDMRFIYYNGGSFILAPKNSVSLTCS